MLNFMHFLKVMFFKENGCFYLTVYIMSENNSKGTSNGQEQTNGPITNGNSLYNAPGDDTIDIFFVKLKLT